ncbi:hypothetical protein BKA62DRAFT_609146, partial [Auriculariales sp. MPI-PUGE-AT-0066]
LRSSSVAFLVKKTPIQSDMSIPAPIMNIPPLLVVPKHLLTRKPATAAEAELQNSLQMAVNVYNAQTASLSEAHAHLVLQDTYVARCRAQIAEAEQKRKSSATRNARLLGDGLPQLLTSNEFVAWADAASQAQAAKKAQDELRAAAKQRWRTAMAEWTKICEPINARNDAINGRYAAAKLAYQEESDAADAEHRRRRMTRPKRGPLEKLPTQPRQKDFIISRDDACEEFGEELEE